MKKFKKALAVLLAGTMALAMLTACGGGGTTVPPVEVRGTFDKWDEPVTVGEIEISACGLTAEVMDGAYSGYERVTMDLSVRNNSKMPLDVETTGLEWSDAIHAADSDAAMRSFFSKGSKYFAAAADGVSVKARTWYMGVYGDMTTTTVKTGERGSLELVMLVPQGWSELQVTFKPSNGKGASAVFYFTASDVSNRT